MSESFDINPLETNLETPTCPTCGEEIKGKWEHDDGGDYFDADDNYDSSTNEHKRCEVDRLVGDLDEGDRKELVDLYKACNVIVNLGENTKRCFRDKFFMSEFAHLDNAATDILDELQAGRDYDPKWAE